MSLKKQCERWRNKGVADSQEGRSLVNEPLRLEKDCLQERKSYFSANFSMLEKFSSESFDIHQKIKEIYKNLISGKMGPHVYLVNALYDVPLHTVDFYLPQIW
jgi:hypothetical protein